MFLIQVVLAEGQGTIASESSGCVKFELNSNGYSWTEKKSTGHQLTIARVVVAKEHLSNL